MVFQKKNSKTVGFKIYTSILCAVTELRFSGVGSCTTYLASMFLDWSSGVRRKFSWRGFVQWHSKRYV